MNNPVQLYLDNCDAFCYPGKTITGRVECFFNKQKSLRAVRVKFLGRAETKWTESESYYDSTEKKHKTKQIEYSAVEIYFDAVYNLLTGGDNFSLPVGRHSFPFTYILPAQLPSSYDGEYGKICYTITAIIDRAWKFDYEAVARLNIRSPLDLNYLPGLHQPVERSTDKEVCCCWCKSGPITFNMSLPATGYVPGQKVNIGTYVENMSNITAECVKFKLYQVVEFVAHYPCTKSKCSSSTVCITQDGAIGAHGEKSWTSELVIPANFPFPNLLSCRIMNVSYNLHGEVVLPCPHSNLDLEFPFVIGSVPVSGVNFNVPGPPSTIAEVSVPSAMPGASAGVGISEITPLLHTITAPHSAQISNIPPYPSEKHDSQQPNPIEPSCIFPGGNSYLPSAPSIAPIGINPQSSSSDPPSYEEVVLSKENNEK